jgi:Anti-sigma factor NepR
MDPDPTAAGSNVGGDAVSMDEDGMPAPLDPSTVEAIGDALETYYRALIEEPLPARLLVLLAELEAKEGGAAET